MKVATKLLVLVSIAGLITVAGVLAGLDYVAYRFDAGSCVSENLFSVGTAISRFMDEEGRTPESMEELRPYIEIRLAGTTTTFRQITACMKSEQPFVWNPGLKSEEGLPVLLMCPAGSHGFLRRYSWGIIPKKNRSGDSPNVSIVRIRSDGRVLPI